MSYVDIKVESNSNMTHVIFVTRLKLFMALENTSKTFYEYILYIEGFIIKDKPYEGNF